MNCGICKFPLTAKYVRYRDTVGQPYCRECYIQIGGVI